MGGPPRVPPLLPPGWLAPLAGRRVRAAPPGPPGSGPAGGAGNPLSPEAAAALFADLAAQAYIRFDYPVNYCFARAHEMRRLMAERVPPVEARKVWNFSPNFRREGGTHDQKGRMREEGALRVSHPEIGSCAWTYHVSVTVVVDGAGGPRTMVLDPALFDRPVTPEEWRAAQGEPESILEETDGGIYTPKDSRDDDYSRTREDLDRARMGRDAWEHGLVPDAGDFEDGLVPGEDEAVLEEAG